MWLSDIVFIPEPYYPSAVSEKGTSANYHPGDAKGYNLHLRTPFPSAVWQKRHGEVFILACLKGMIFVPEPPYPSAVWQKRYRPIRKRTSEPNTQNLLRPIRTN